jgi:cell division septum initiation protein DivIVA
MEQQSNNISIESLQTEVLELKEEIKELKKSIEELSIICGRMNNHITFVENTYEGAKAPLNWVKQKIEYVMNKGLIQHKIQEKSESNFE